MARKPLEPEALVAISRTCADLFVRAGGSSPTVAALATEAGLAERSFYRYFPTKEDSLRPLFDDGNHAFAQAIEAQSAEDGFGEALVHAFERTFATSDDEQSRAIMATVFADPALRRVWLEASYETAAIIRPGVARHIRAEESAVETTVACGQAVLFVIAGLTHMVRDGLSSSEAAAAVARAMFGRPDIPSGAASAPRNERNINGSR
ncbi:TetR/AcrR family transcriptional regulator [Nocardia cyriacigeorgica]|uniref:TetR/AcrR family transcriptional regulator n=1 Tax=Nocardia cyriacigeorgica TaxID=135487 RepID=A0A6P1D5A9_9NOCA|nr:TetR/AcrR family transcriptional regulator [Nocardia cyriacigeorgica]NEW38148.1 TetR/AcrR family transcriptional regulator [Nocardia cyriacigeorgica]NEW45806.1 TetR/AcrR family transcriptional regulator [Nocardia cyriacigeorgica]NEW48469.1 TetR/AcrR family transcriptional regulator [Nocardia cyriacigeorgica]